MASVEWASTGISPGLTNMLRRDAQIERIFRSPAVEALRWSPVLPDVARMQEILGESTAGVQESIRATQAVFQSEAHAALMRQQEHLKTVFAQVNPAISAVAEMQAQMQHVQAQVRDALGVIPVADVPGAQEIVRSAFQAAARLSDIDKVRVRNALAHWQGVSERMRRDELALALATVDSWREEGSTKLRSFASILGKAFDRWLLEAVARSLRRSPALHILAVSPRPRLPRFVDRCIGALRDLKWSISPNAPPVCLA
jgi:hypothetical protein